MHAYRNQQALRRSRPQPALRLPAATRPWCPERSWRGREDRPHPQTGRGHAIHLLWRRRAKGWGRHHCPSPMAAARIGARETRVEGCGDVMRTNGLQTASRISWVGGLSVRSGDSKPDQWGGWSFGGMAYGDGEPGARRGAVRGGGGAGTGVRGCLSGNRSGEAAQGGDAMRGAREWAVRPRDWVQLVLSTWLST